MPELTPEYIASITEAELRAAGYHVRQITSYRFEEPIPGYLAGVKEESKANREVAFCVDEEEAWRRNRYDFAPRKALEEAQARIIALEALVREAYAAIDIDNIEYDDSGFIQGDWHLMSPYWRGRAAKLLEVGDV